MALTCQGGCPRPSERAGQVQAHSQEHPHTQHLRRGLSTAALTLRVHADVRRRSVALPDAPGSALRVPLSWLCACFILKLVTTCK